MSDETVNRPQHLLARLSGPSLALCGALCLALCVALVYAPALDLELLGDDYQMVVRAHEGSHDPIKLLAPVGQFFIPLSTWALAIDRAVWGTNAFGFQLTLLVLHVVASWLLGCVATRLGMTTGAAFMISLVWACSPFTSEVAMWTATRPDQSLFIAWCLLILSWPRHDERWTRHRRGGAFAATLLALFSKEGWVVVPGIVLALELTWHRSDIRRAARTTLPFAIAVVLFVVVRFSFIPGVGGYYLLSPEVLSKVPNMLAAFLYLEPLQPVVLPITMVGLAAVAIVAALVAAGWRHNRPAVGVGGALLVLPLAPILLIPYMPTHYAHVPYAGFLLLATAAVDAFGHGLSSRLRPVARLSAYVVAGLMALAGISMARASIADHARVSAAHTTLLQEARAFSEQLPLDRPVVVVRLETDNPLLAIARDPRGPLKLWYTRHEDPYGLIDAGALFDWTLDQEHILVRSVDDWPARLVGVPGAVVGHERGGFRLLEPAVDDVAEAAARWRERGYRLRVIQAEEL